MIRYPDQALGLPSAPARPRVEPCPQQELRSLRWAKRGERPVATGAETEVDSEAAGEPDGSSTGRVPQRPGGRLRRLAGGRQGVVKVRLSARELGLLEARAAAAGVSKQRFMVELATKGNWAPAERHALYRVLYAVQGLTSGVANNLNQLARVANTTGQVLPRYDDTALAVREAMESLQAVLAKLSAEAFG